MMRNPKQHMACSISHEGCDEQRHVLRRTKRNGVLRTGLLVGLAFRSEVAGRLQTERGPLGGTPYYFPAAETRWFGCGGRKLFSKTATRLCRFYVDYLPYAGGQRGKNDAGLFSYSGTQCCVDAGLPAFAVGFEGSEQIGVDAQADECFARSGRWWRGGWRRWLWSGRLRRWRGERCWWGWLRRWLDEGGESGILWCIFEDHFRAPGVATTVATIPWDVGSDQA